MAANPRRAGTHALVAAAEDSEKDALVEHHESDRAFSAHQASIGGTRRGCLHRSAALAAVAFAVVLLLNIQSGLRGTGSLRHGRVAEVMSKGSIRHPHHGLCLAGPRNGSAGDGLRMAACAKGEPEQDWRFDNSTGQIKSKDGSCLDALQPGELDSEILMSKCNSDLWGQQWEYLSEGRWAGRLRNRHGRCLAAAAAARGVVHLAVCHANDTDQHWRIQEEPDMVPELDHIQHRYGLLCLSSDEGTKEGGQVTMEKCTVGRAGQGWIYKAKTGHITLKGGLCLHAPIPGDEGSTVLMSACQPSSWSQRWQYDDVSGNIKNRHGLCLASVDPSQVGSRLQLERCDRRWQEQWRVQEGTAASATPMPPSMWMSPSLFCFSLMRLTGYEPNLMRFQLQQGTGIFACEEFAVFNEGNPTVLGQLKSGYFSTMSVPNAQLSGERGRVGTAGTTTNSWLNAMIFMQVWDSVRHDGRFLSHDWTVKADPDAVVLVDRLRQHLGPFTSRSAKYVHNSNFWPDVPLLGAVEVFSSGALDEYFAMGAACATELDWHGWGEDYFMRHCLDHLGIAHVVDLDLLSDGCCRPRPCNDMRVAAFHPHKDVESYRQCYTLATTVASV